MQYFETEGVVYIKCVRFIFKQNTEAKTTIIISIKVRWLLPNISSFFLFALVYF